MKYETPVDLGLQVAATVDPTRPGHHFVLKNCSSPVLITVAFTPPIPSKNQPPPVNWTGGIAGSDNLHRLVPCVNAGDTVVRASVGTKLSAEVTIHVVDTPTLTITPSDTSGSPGDTFNITATTSAAIGGGFTWQLVSIRGGDSTEAFQFLTQPPCIGVSTCTATVRANSPAFTGVQVGYSLPNGQFIQQTARLRAIFATITKIWSDQFPNGPVANFLPGGAGLVGNARQLLIMGARGDSRAYLKAEIAAFPNNDEAKDHILLRLQPAKYPPTGNTNAPVGSSSRSNSTYSVSAQPAVDVTDYFVVAGPDRSGAGQESGILLPQDVSTRFVLDCPVEAFKPPFCSMAAVRIVSAIAYSTYTSAGILGTPVEGLVIGFPTGVPTARAFASAFLANDAPTGDAVVVGSPSVTIDSVNSTRDLYFNNGLLFDTETTAPVKVYTFGSSTALASHILQDTDFQQLLLDTLSAHTAEVRAYFGVNPTATNHVFPSWQVIGGCQAEGVTCTPPSYFDDTPSNVVDQPRIFPCATQPNKECDLTFANDPDLQNAFGRVGYNVQIVANVNRSATDPLVLTLSTVAVVGNVFDTYQWNFAFGRGDYFFSDIQAGYGSLGSAGNVYKTVVQLYAPALILPFTFR